MTNVYQLSGNPLLCDCTLEWALNGDIVSDLDLVTCQHHDQTLSHVSHVTRDTFLCHYTTHCFSLCRCCTFLACDCRMNCPDTCTCLHDEVSPDKYSKMGPYQGHKVRRNTLKLIFLIYESTKPNIEVSGWLCQIKIHFTNIFTYGLGSYAPTCHTRTF